ncbi:hypothetical protein RKE25_10915 [Dyella sp. BiH032]|uniref:hypothetical protein n=1 Tax=Dyella sp. BiH032 TaxID=3075430 RepID=UPI002892E22D|nr:hypothetical protein [Dyella sp. BiH032]WNL48102.1 hypothetical protein RKE25_10915 [Dyella sp. BiH032]
MSKPDDNKSVTVRITDSFKLSSQGRGTTRRDDAVIGYTESRLNGRAAHASLGPDGISHGLSGSPPTNETGTMETCTYLIAAMNRTGAGSTWGQPVLVDEHDDADAICGKLNGGSEVLRIQVVRAQSNAAFWKEVHVNHGATMSGTAVELATELKAPIAHKAGLLPPAQRGQLVLALSALHTPGYVLGDVAEKFREHHGAWAGSMGFREIWLVGPGVELTHRLA